MAEVLSQSEIDALLSAVSTGNVATEEASGPEASTDWISYDLTSQEKILRSRFAALEGIHDRFASYFRVTLSSLLKRTVAVNHVATDFLKFSDYLTNILLPTSLNIILMPKLKGHLILIASSKLTYALVDAYYGGSERPYSKIGGREVFTGIENQLINKTIHRALKDLQRAWEINLPMEFEFLRAESNPQFVGAIHPTEIVAVVNFEVEFENLSGPFIMLLQLSSLEQVQRQLSVNLISNVSADIQKWNKHWLIEIMTSEVDVRAELGFLHRSLRQVREFNEGDQILSNQDAASPLTVFVEGFPVMEGMMGTLRGNKAVRVVSPMNIYRKQKPTPL